MKYTVFPWCTSITLHKIFGKITQVIKSTQHGNFRNTFPGGTQKLKLIFNLYAFRKSTGDCCI